jgi:hypothetical protein
MAKTRMGAIHFDLSRIDEVISSFQEKRKQALDELNTKRAEVMAVLAQIDEKIAELGGQQTSEHKSKRKRRSKAEKEAARMRSEGDPRNLAKE